MLKVAIMWNFSLSSGSCSSASWTTNINVTNFHICLAHKSTVKNVWIRKGVYHNTQALLYTVTLTYCFKRKQTMLCRISGQWKWTLRFDVINILFPTMVYYISTDQIFISTPVLLHKWIRTKGCNLSTFLKVTSITSVKASLLHLPLWYAPTPSIKRNITGRCCETVETFSSHLDTWESHNPFSSDQMC